MRRLRSIKRDDRGAAALELALALPVVVSMIYGIVQAGLYYHASAGMQHALGEGARFATLCAPTEGACVPPSDEQIKSKIASMLFGKVDGKFSIADPVEGKGYRELSITYTKKMNFLFFDGPTITMTKSKRAYTAS